MKPKQGLQKLTKSEIKTIDQNEVKKIFALEKITYNDIKDLNVNQVNIFIGTITTNLNTLVGTEWDSYYEKVQAVVAKDTKNHIWEAHHSDITAAISNLMQKHNRMPSRNEIAQETQLSRQTIHKHMAEYASNPQYLQQVEQFRFLTTKVLAKVFVFAVQGDIGAAKLYFNVMGCLGGQSNNTLIQNQQNTQNNYIQINGTVLSQETIKHLNPEQLTAIENILKVALPQTLKTETKSGSEQLLSNENEP
jgi:hypothetical protein